MKGDRPKEYNRDTFSDEKINPAGEFQQMQDAAAGNSLQGFLLMIFIQEK